MSAANTISGSLGVLTAMISPAILIATAGQLANTMANRLNRVMDMILAVEKDARHLDVGADPEGCRALADQIRLLGRRGRLLRNALLFDYLAILLFILASILIGVGGWWPLHYTPAIAAGCLGLLSLLWASFQLVREGISAFTAGEKRLSTVERRLVQQLGTQGGDRG